MCEEPAAKKKKHPVAEKMDQKISALNKQPAPSTSPSDKKSLREQFKMFELTKVRPPNLDLLFSALKTIPPSSTEVKNQINSPSFLTKLAFASFA